MLSRSRLSLLLPACAASVAIVLGGSAYVRQQTTPLTQAPPVPFALGPDDERFLEDLSRRAFQYFWQQADPATGIVRDRARTDGTPASERSRHIGSIASVGFGLSGLCIAVERGWVPRAEGVARARATLRFFAERMDHQRGWFFHFVNLETGAREWQSEVSSIDTALLLAGVLTVRRCFEGDPVVVRYANTIYRRVDFRWMLAADGVAADRVAEDRVAEDRVAADGVARDRMAEHPTLLSHGWKPESGFLPGRWDHYCELMILYLLAIGSPTHPIPSAAWHGWTRPAMTFQGFTYVGAADPLFVHQYAHAWVDLRGRREERPPHIDWFQNSVTATRAHKAFCLSLSSDFPGYADNVWGITASDSRKGYVGWGGPPRHSAIDGSVVPAAAAGSLMFAPDISMPALREMHRRFGERIYGRYGFADAFDPVSGWVNPDVIGIDLGITLLSAENLRSGRIWGWFMKNPEIPAALDRAGVRRSDSSVK